MIPVPKIDAVNGAFGDIKHMPKYSEVPEDFRRGHTAYNDFVSSWFFSGRTEKDMARLTAKDGVDRAMALRAISAILRSFEPKHEHKEAGAAYLLSQWFDLAPEKP